MKPLNSPLISDHLALPTQLIFPSKLLFLSLYSKLFLIQHTVLACILGQFHSNPSPTTNTLFYFLSSCLWLTITSPQFSHTQTHTVQRLEQRLVFLFGHLFVSAENPFETVVFLLIWSNCRQTMAGATNWLTFSLTPVEVLRSPDSSSHCFLDNFYATNGNATLKHSLSLYPFGIGSVLHNPTHSLTHPPREPFLFILHNLQFHFSLSFLYAE